MAGDEVDLTGGIWRKIYSRAVFGKRINAVSIQAECLFWRLHCICDDFGNFESDPAVCRHEALPMRSSVKETHVATWLDELGDVMPPLVIRWQLHGLKLGHIVEFEQRQSGRRNGRKVRRFASPPESVIKEWCSRVHPGASGCIRGSPKHPSASEHDQSMIRSEKKKAALSPPPASGGKPKRAWKPDPIWDAVCEVFGFKTVPYSQRTRLGKVVRDLREMSATPEEIRDRHRRAVAAWKGAEFGPEAIVKHWFQLDQDNAAPAMSVVLPDSERSGFDPEVTR